MIRMKKLINIILPLFIASCICLACLLVNLLILTPFFIGDEVSYMKKGVTTGPIFNLFYEISSDTGYMPDVSRFNIIFTIMLGFIIGFVFAKKVMNFREQNNTLLDS